MYFLFDRNEKGGFATIGGGQSIRLRVVVDDELWSLRIHVPQKRALQMSDLCRQIIEDVMEGVEFDEWKYVRMLEQIEFHDSAAISENN